MTEKKNVTIMSKKAGLSPGTLEYYGEKSRPVQIAVTMYNETTFSEYEYEGEQDFSTYTHTSTDHVIWIQITGTADPQFLEKIGQEFSIHPLVLEDITSSGHRPKCEEYPEYLFIILQVFEQTEPVQPQQICMIVGKSFLISFQEKPSEIFEPLQHRIRNGKGKIRRMGPDYLAYALMDVIVDNYFVILEDIGEQLEDIEAELLHHPTPETLWNIQEMKQTVMILRRSVWPLREVINILEREDVAFMTQSTGLYLRDVYDHTIQVIDILESYRDILSGLVDIYLSEVSNKMNEIMKVLTVIATIFIPLTFITSIYGMNFLYMPELQMKWGYPAVIFIMGCIGMVMILYFRKKKWI